MLTVNLSRLLLALLLLALVPSFAAARPIDEGAQLDADEQTKVLVERRLQQDDVVKFHRVEVSVQQGVVTLTGTVRTASAKAALLSEVQKVRGVRAIEERVKVEPTP